MCVCGGGRQVGVGASGAIYAMMGGWLAHVLNTWNEEDEFDKGLQLFQVGQEKFHCCSGIPTETQSAAPPTVSDGSTSWCSAGRNGGSTRSNETKTIFCVNLQSAIHEKSKERPEC